MKTIKFLIVILISIFSFNFNVLAASSKFDATVNLIPEISNDEVTIIIGYTGEEIMAVSNYISWDSNYLMLSSVGALEDYNVTNNNPVIDGKYNTIKVLGDSDYSYSDSNYAVVVFQMTDKFTVGQKTDVIFYNYEAAGIDIYKYKHKGYILKLERETRDKMVSYQNVITDKTKMEYWFKENWLLVALGVLVVVAVLVLILVMPTKRRKEQREKKVSEQAKDKDYNYGKNNYKIDHQKLDQIAGINQNKDMSEAIVISDINPFQSAVGTERTVAGQENVINTQPMGSVNLPPQAPVAPQAPVVQAAPVVNAGVNLVDNIPVNNNPENLAQVYIPDQVLAPGQAEVQAPVNRGFVTMPEPVAAPVVEETLVTADPFAPAIDPFNMKITPEAPVAPVEQAQQVVQQPVQQVQQVQQVAPVAQAPVQQVDETEMFQEIEDTPQVPNNNNDNLVLFQPQNFESAHKASNDIETLVLAFIFLLGALVLPSSVTALNYEVDELRACIVGNIPHDNKYDYNNDGVVDVIDVITTKDLNNVTMESVGETHPGYITIEEQGYTTTRRPGYKPPSTKKTTTTHPGFKTTTRLTSGIDITIDDDKTTTVTTTKPIIIIGGETTKKTSSRKTTTKIGGTTKKTTTTTTRKTTTKKTTTTTTKKSSSRKTNSTKTTTTKKSTTTAPVTYKVTFRAENGSVATSSVTVSPGKTAVSKITPNAGYKYASVSCGKPLTDFVYNSSTNEMTVYNVSGSAVCTVKFTINTYKINFTIFDKLSAGQLSSVSKSVNHGKAAYVTFDATHYDIVSKTCTKHTPVFTNNQFRVEKATNSDNCELVVQPKFYTITLNDKDGNLVTKIQTNYTPSQVTQRFVSSKSWSKITCGISSKTLTKSGNEYSFKYQVTKNMTCTLT